MTGGAYVCKTCQVGGGCPTGCSTGGEWFCCLTGGAARRVPVPLLGVQLPVRLLEPVLLLLHEPPDAVPAAAALGRPAVHLPGGRRAERWTRLAA